MFDKTIGDLASFLKILDVFLIKCFDDLFTSFDKSISFMNVSKILNVANFSEEIDKGRIPPLSIKSNVIGLLPIAP